MLTHEQRLAQTTAAFEAAMDRFLTRLDGVPSGAAERAPASGGWSPAAIAWHVAATNEGFAGLVDGSRPLARAPEEGFVETPFHEIAALVPDRLETPDVFQPPADVRLADVLPRLRESARRFVEAYRGLTPERGGWTVKSILGDLTVYQVGDWAVAHVARHNAQTKRVLGASPAPQ